MFTDIINTMKFDITCTNETTASDIERVVAYDTVNGIAQILEQIGMEDNDTDLKQIDKIEIDLGDMTTKAFTDFTFHDHLKGLLTKELAKHKNTTHALNAPISPVENSVRARRDLVREFLLSGGLPWWADKNNTYVLDDIMQELLLRSPSVILPVLVENTTNAAVRFRLQTHFSSVTKSMISDLLANGHVPATDTVSIAASGQILHDALKAILSWLLTRQPGQHVWSLLNQFNNLPPDELSVLNMYANGNNDPALRNKVQDVFLKLTLPQLSFLWQAAALAPPHPGESNKMIAPVGVHRLSDLAKGLQCNEHALGDFLQTFSRQQTQALKKVINQNATETQLKHKLANLIAANPPLLKRAFEKIPPAGLAARDIPNAAYLLSQERAANTSALNFFTRILKKQSAISLGEAAQFAISESHSLPYPATETKKIIIENAGLCILAPYLPALFKHLNYLGKNNFTSPNTAYRALLLLQYAATGQKNNQEYTLQLNKLLCGIIPNDPVPVWKRLKAEEMKEADELLLAIINNWAALKNTSIEGLRNSFLQRKGLLFENEHNWTLQIEKKAYDVLLDSIPWAFNLIKLTWMKKAIHVEW
jgi:hypothetical protein